MKNEWGYYRKHFLSARIFMDPGFREFGCDDPKCKALSWDKTCLQDLVRYCSWRAFTPLKNVVNLLESQYYFGETLIFYGTHVRQIPTLVPNVLFFLYPQNRWDQMVVMGKEEKFSCWQKPVVSRTNKYPEATATNEPC
jgi:hypothetical protein